MKIRDCSFADIQHFASRAAKERVSITDTRDTRWHAAYDEAGNIVGCGAVMFTRQTARLKAYFIEPSMRGSGLGSALVQKGIDTALDNPAINTIEVFSVNPKFFLAKGFTRLKDIRDGVTHLIKRA